ncbi:MAG: hypothetical protein HY898_29525 [Deltaproteobacteria bacterium]|nr:hypothetical protein [Deltaproteobacteria bacterium]
MNLMRYAAGMIALAALVVPSLAHADEPAAKEAGAISGGPPPVAAPVEGKPIRFYSVPGDEIYALMDDHTVRVLSSGKKVLEFSESDDKYQIGRVFCAAAPSEKVACLYFASKTEGQGQSSTTYKKLVLVDGTDKKTIGHGSGNGYDIGGLGIHLSTDGKLTYIYSEAEQSGQAVVTKTWLVSAEGKEQLKIGSASLLAELASIGGGDRKDPPVQFVDFKGQMWLVYRDGSSIAVKTLITEPVEVAKRSLHDIRPVVTSDGWFYIFYHDAGTNTANVAKSKDGATWEMVQLDTKESGWQMEAVAKDDLAVCVFYYMRNSFNKGLRVAMLKGGAIDKPAYTIEREEKFNTGWHPNLGVAGDGTTWLTYLEHVEEKKRSWSKFASLEDLKKHEVAGGTGWEEEYKDYYLQTGAGVWYTWWMLRDSVPGASDTPALATPLSRTSYNVGAALLTSGNIEARYGSFNLGASYAQSIIDDASKSVGGNSGVLNGQIKIDDLMLGHDLKLAMIWGRYRGKATQTDVLNSPGYGAEASEIELKTNYINVQVLLLNKWRIKYGFDYSQFTVPATVHAFYSAQNSTTYEYQGSAFRDVTFKNYNGIIGFSKLDYAAKYENHYNDFYFDGAFSMGYTAYSFNTFVTQNGVEKTGGSALNFRLIGQLGWLFFHRWKSAHGLGFYVRPAYTADWSYIGSGGKPGDRKSEDASKGDDMSARVGLMSFRHGPWLDIGLVW